MSCGRIPRMESKSDDKESLPGQRSVTRKGISPVR
jgi:hypothetical protein